MPIASGSRTHQKASTSATQSGKPGVRPVGMYSSPSATNRLRYTNHSLTGCRMRLERLVGCTAQRPPSVAGGGGGGG